MEHYINYQLSELTPCIKQLRDIFDAAATHSQQALYEKYKDAKYDCVATLSAPANLPFDEMDTEDSLIP